MKNLTPEQHGRIGNFLEEYKALCLKYGVCVDGCGCCNSPFLGFFNVEKTDLETHVKAHIDHLANEVRT